jgi:hypothetical protein
MTKVSITKDSVTQVRAEKVRAAQVRAAKVRAAKVRADKVRAMKVSAVKVHAAKVSAAKVIAVVRKNNLAVFVVNLDHFSLHFQFCFPPCIRIKKVVVQVYSYYCMAAMHGTHGSELRVYIYKYKNGIKNNRGTIGERL